MKPMRREQFCLGRLLRLNLSKRGVSPSGRLDQLAVVGPRHSLRTTKINSSDPTLPTVWTAHPTPPFPALLDRATR
jgi:hypothetical protein